MEPNRRSNHGIDDVTNHYADIIAKLPVPPIVIGHSFGGLLAEKLLGLNLGSAAIAIDPVQINGVLPNSPAAVQTDNESRGPLLLIMGGHDHTVPESFTKSTYKQYRHSDAETELMEFRDRGHSLTIDSG